MPSNQDGTKSTRKGGSRSGAVMSRPRTRPSDAPSATVSTSRAGVTRADADLSTERDAAPGLEAVKPHLTGMTGMHIDQPETDAATGSPGADTDRDLAQEN